MSKSTRTDPSPLSSHIGYQMRLVSNAVSQSFARKLSASEVTVAEWVILREMYSADGKTSPSAVAQLTGLTRGAVSKLIERLLLKDFVSRSESSGDRRYQDIKLTPKAVKLVPKLASLADENDQSFFATLSEVEQKALMKALQKLAQFHQLKTNPID